MGVRVVFPDMGKDPSVQLIEKTITENGTYDAITDGANGYSKVNVNVEGGGGSSDLTWVIPEQSVELTKDNATPLSNVGEIVDGDIIVAKATSSQDTFQTYLTGVARERSSRLIVNLCQDDMVFCTVGQRDGSWVILPNVTAQGSSLFSAVKIKQF